MSENRIARVLRIIGIVEVVCGIILGFIVLANGKDSGWIGIAVMITSFITCMMFMGFAEIINLLQKSVDNQDAVLALLKEQPTKEKVAPKSVLQDIESNLPEM